MNSLIVGGQLVDLGEEFGIKINKSVNDIRGSDVDRLPSTGDFTHTIVLPGSKPNCKLFTHIYQLDNSVTNLTTTNFNPDFNPNIKAECKYLVDEVEQIAGFMRLDKVVRLEEGIEFHCTIHGKTADWARKIGQGKLADLDFAEFNHLLTYTHVSETWDTRIQKNGSNYTNFSGGFPTGEGYVYALIDDGSYDNYYGNTNLSQFYPALYVKQIIDKIFDATGYTYTSDSFFTDQYFKQLVVPCPTGMQLGAEDMLEREFEATKLIDQSIAALNTQLTFPSETFDTGGNYSIVTSEYTSPISGANEVFWFDNQGTITGLSNSTNYQIQYGLFVNGIFRSNANITFTTNGSGTGTIDRLIPFYVILQTSDVVQLKVTNLQEIPALTTPVGWTYTQESTSRFYNKLTSISWGLNGSVDFSAFFNQETTQIEFIRSIFTLFNLYCEPVVGKEKELFIQTRDSFFDGSTENWSEKLDLLEPLEIIPMGELDANPYYFTYAKGEDTENKDYQALFDRTYGDKKYFVDNDFIDKEKKIEVIFAPTQMLKAEGYDKILSYVPLEMDKGTGQLRLLYFDGLKSCSAYAIFDNSNMTGSSNGRTDYPLTLHTDDPDAMTEDLGFGMPFRVNLPAGTTYTNNNLINKYWLRYLEEVTDPNSSLVRGFFDISPAAFNQLTFRNIYFFERTYFYLNQIINYDPENPQMTECEFLKIKTANSFTPGTGTVGGGVDIGDEPPPVGFPKDERLKTVGMMIGRDNSGGEETLIVGDRIITGYLSRGNTALGSYDSQFLPNATGATMINSYGIEANTGELWIQNALIALQGATNGQVLSYNSSTNTWEPVTAGAASFAYTVHTIAAADSPYTITDTAGFHVYLVNATAGPVTLKPPAAATVTAQYVFKKTDASANAMIIDPNGAELIDGGATASITVQYSSITTVSDGANLQII